MLKGENLEVKMSEPGYPQTVSLGVYKIPLIHFLNLVENVLTISDIEPNDPRLEFIERWKKIKVVDGAIPGKKRMSV